MASSAPDASSGGPPSTLDLESYIANYQGGDFLGVLDAMEEDWFEQLGANVLWLTPVYENPDGPYLAADGVNNFSGFHGYWPTDPFAIEGKFGDAFADSEDRLVELIYALKAGHRQNGRFVMNRKTQALIRKFKDADGNYLFYFR